MTIFDAALPVGVSTLGRAAENRFVIDGPRISRFHAAVFISADGACHVQDMGSKNGTLVEGRRVARLRLNAGDVFQVGSHDCEVIASEIAQHADPSTLDGADDDAGASPDDSSTFLGTSPAARRLLAQARRVADTNLTALISGETGSGKGVIARQIHQWSSRAAGPFVVVNCAAIPAELVESELFGHRKGAFTGAISDRPGKFRAANGGTLLLDEIGDLPAAAQAKILRAIDEQEIEPLGEPGPVRVDVRVLAATHHDIARAVKEGRFRMDLQHRLATVRLHVPPLRERKEDLVALASWFLAELVDDIPWAQGAVFSTDAIAALTDYDWPGNVRELRNVIAQGLLAKQGSSIGSSDLGMGSPAGSAEGVPATATLAEVEAQHVARALEHHGGNIRKTAKALGISRSSLHERMDRLGMPRGGASGDEAPGGE